MGLKPVRQQPKDGVGEKESGHETGCSKLLPKDVPPGPATKSLVVRTEKNQAKQNDAPTTPATR